MIEQRRIKPSAIHMDSELHEEHEYDCLRKQGSIGKNRTYEFNYLVGRTIEINF